jgi:hypothetical protein
MRIASWVGRAVGMLPPPPLPVPPLLPEPGDEEAVDDEDAVDAERDAVAGDDFVMILLSPLRATSFISIARDH